MSGDTIRHTFRLDGIFFENAFDGFFIFNVKRS